MTSHPQGYDEDNGNYIKTLNDHLVYRYQILDVIGKGSFGQVRFNFFNFKRL